MLSITFNMFRVDQNSDLPSVVTDVDLPSTTIEKISLTIHTGTFTVTIVCVLYERILFKTEKAIH